MDAIPLTLVSLKSKVLLSCLPFWAMFAIVLISIYVSKCLKNSYILAVWLTGLWINYIDSFEVINNALFPLLLQ